MGQPHFRLESTIVNDPPPWIPAGQSSDANPTHSVATTTGGRDRFGPGSSRTDGFTPFVTSRAATTGPSGQAGPGVAESGPSAGTGKVRAENAGAATSARFLDEPGSNPTGGMVALAGAAGPGGPGGGGGDPEPPGGTEPEQPTVRIASPGKHDDDQGDPPQVIQGSSYKAVYVATGTSATVAGADVQWVAEVTTWAYPSKVAKGYGTFVTVKPDDPGGDPDGDYTRFVAQPSSVSGTKVEWQGFTDQDDMDYDTTQRNEAGAVVDHFIDTFYWGPMNKGIQAVSVSVTFRKYVNGQATEQKTTQGDRVELDVLKPTGTMSLISMGIPGVTPPQKFRSQYLSMAKDTPRGENGHANGTPLGMRYSSSVTVPAGFGGVFMHNQTMTTNEHRLYQDATGVHHEVRGKYNGQPYDLSSNFVLDTDVGYPGRVDDPAVGPGASPKVSTAPVGHTFYSVDSPGSPLLPPVHSTGIDWFRVNSFRITLMYNPLAIDPNDPPAGPPDSIWVPVGVLSWYWGAFAVFSGVQWVDDPDPDHPPLRGTFGNYQAGPLYPTWSVNIEDANGNKNGDGWVPLP